MTATVDGKFYEVAGAGGIAEQLLIKARDQIFRDFNERMMPDAGCTVLDVGVSDVINDGANVLERKYPYLHNVTACGLGDCVEFQRAFPDVTFQQIEPNQKLPFHDAAFDIATSNAVLEHVGSRENQIFFLRELVRVSKRTFMTVPNRFFPIEHHTAIPLLHFNDRSFQIACKMLRKSSWADPKNLILMTQRKLLSLANGLERKATVGYTGIRIGPLSSNLFMAL